MMAKMSLGYRQVLACFMMLGAAGMIAATYSILAVPLGDEYQPSRAVLMLSMTIFAGTSAALSPIFGDVMDRISLRKLMLLGSVLLAIGYAAIGFTTQFWQVLLIFGLFVAPANVLIGPVAMTVLLARWFDETRGRAVGIAIAGVSAGGVLFPFIIQALLDAYDWRVAMQLLGLVILIWTLPAAMLIKDRPDPTGDVGEDATPSGLDKSDMPAKQISVRQILGDPAFWMIAATVAIVTAGMKGMVTNLVPMAIDNGIDAGDAAHLISIFAGASFIAKINFAALSDRIGPRTLMAFALGGFGVGLCCLTQAQAGYWVIALGVALAGLFGGLMIPMESYLAPRIFGQSAVGRAMGLLAGVILLGLLCTPPLFGLIFDLTGTYSGIFWAFGGLSILAVLWVPTLRLHPRDIQPETD